MTTDQLSGLNIDESRLVETVTRIPYYIGQKFKRIFPDLVMLLNIDVLRQLVSRSI